MFNNPEISAFGYILLFLLGSFVFVQFALTFAWLLRPHRPNFEKQTSYECGEEPTGSAWGQFNIRFYIVALIFVLFDVELVFLFPWATIFGQAKFINETNGLWGWFALTEAFVFIAVLLLGLAYVWKKGFLDWIKPQAEVPTVQTKVPKNLYDQINQKYSQK